MPQATSATPVTTDPTVYVEYQLHEDTPAMRHRLVGHGESMRFHAGFTKADADAGWSQVTAGSAAGLTEADIEAKKSALLREHLEFWLGLHKKYGHDRVIANGRHYLMSDTPGGGFGGSMFRIQFLDKKRWPKKRGLWAQGKVPAWMRQRMPDNATIEEVPGSGRTSGAAAAAPEGPDSEGEPGSGL